ncbi:Flp pilus assembly protein, protease CpaA [Hoeflea phototrophica DFL-43]|uniref:Flp pilus assembly protein, protease CpaA n=1 Tax=Hoeflea phototrophica (strain DSM 17068 / NCIMB 14078 / DFL-43) TaxID=411684 RepID=A9CVQ3_HOEPD|nr:prepilin peptidase [Hoeflea phototrophica]EDQ35409.2 Flp pilus assembly protein, protease CpaA [Hoeflea phototrophica DFL-43]
MVEAAIFIVLPLCLAIAAFTDILTMKIPNRVSIVLGLSFFVVAPLSGMDLATFGWSIVAALIVFAVCFALFAVNVMGGGDAKILSAAALWYGFSSDLVVFLGFTGIYGGLLALVVLMLRANQNILLVSPVPIPMHFFKDRAGIPYGVAIGAAAFSTYPDSRIFIEAIGRLH